MKLSDYVIKFIIKKKVGHVFEVCGGAITHLLDSIYEKKNITAVSMHHEQAAAFAAEGYSRVSGNIGIAMATSGPGATNLITGIGSAFFDSTATLFITGQVNTYEFKFDKPVRQVGFQETDIVNIVKPIVKEAHLITDPGKIRNYMEKSFSVARSGRPGPVLLDIPMDVQRSNVSPNKLSSSIKNKNIKPKINSRIIRKIVGLISSATRPVILVGGGVGVSNARNELLLLLKRTGIPIVSSLMGLDSCPHDLPNFCGMLGVYGNRYANLTVANADLILALGSRLDTRQTGTNPSIFARGAKLVHVDIDPREINNKVNADIGVISDIKDFLLILNKKLSGYKKARIKSWLDKTSKYKERYPSWRSPRGKDIEPNFLMHLLSEVLPVDSIVCLDVGQHQMWAGQSLELSKGQLLITQGGMASMGSSLPMAIGVSFAKPKTPIIVITGDGGFQLNMQELQTVRHHNLPIKIILLNNKGYGMIRQFQKQYFKSRFQSTVKGYSQPDFQKVVSAYGIHSARIAGVSGLKKSFEEIFKNKNPEFLEIMLKESNLVFPKLAVGRPIEEQDPLLCENELKENMLIEALPRKYNEKSRS
ncbi:MAG: acetolactate synthase [Candidatus Omnitrophica bacterium CG11_big_fil_rev_8_21_14_0_20_41_12]|nr:MAG: acetolactate synthase [Candidatus Omnitrophica bacterium CG11_big_fil_rev_8_21_14_0_20_41_12]